MKAKISIPNIKGYLQAHYREALDELGFLESHVKEQALFRLWLVKQRSPECYETNICQHCGCTVDSKIFENRQCSGTCYGEMLGKDKWESYKEHHPKYKEFLGIEVVPDNLPGIGGTQFKIKLSKDMLTNPLAFKSDLDVAADTMNQYSEKALTEAMITERPIPIIIIPENANLPDLLEANPNLSKEELLHWLPQFKQ